MLSLRLGGAVMKRILAIALTLIMVLAALTGCMAPQNPSGDEGEQPNTLPQCLTEENGDYKLTLPKSEEVIELSEEQVRFVPYITDELVEAAENKINNDITHYGNKSDFYLQVTDDYLCLTVEFIEYLDEPDETSVCSDHRHLFFSERISNQPVKDDKVDFESSNKDYRLIQFFPQPTLEFTEEKTYNTEDFEWSRLTDADMELLRRIYDDGKGWTDDSVVDRVAFYFDGRIGFATTDSSGWMYFGFTQNILYYNGMFTEISAKVMDILEGAQDAKSEGDNSQNNDHLVSHIQIQSGANTISPFGYLVWSQTDHGDGYISEMHADRLDMPDVIKLNTGSIPSLVLEERVSYFVQVNGNVENVFLYTPNGDGYTKSETTFDALSNLEDGTYYVAFDVLLSGNCDPEAPQNSYRYEDVFCLVVSNDDFHDHVPYEAMLNLEVMDGKFRFQRIATTPCIVYSNTHISDMKKGRKSRTSG